MNSIKIFNSWFVSLPESDQEELVKYLLKTFKNCEPKMFTESIPFGSAPMKSFQKAMAFGQAPRIQTCSTCGRPL